MVKLNLSSPRFTGKRPSFDSDASSDSTGCPPGVCPKLNFDYMLAGSLRYPSRIKDFMNYLRVVEHTEENLKFLLWYKDYERRFFELSAEEQSKSPIWKSENNATPRSPASRNGSTSSGKSANEKYVEVGTTELTKPPPSPSNLKPCDIKLNEADQFQPFRTECSKVEDMFIFPSSPQELNLYERERVLCLRALQSTTHPSAFAPAAKSVEHSLRHRSHPAFVYRTISSMNESRQRFGYFFTSMFFFLGPVFAALMVLTSWNRWWRIIPCVLTGHGCWVMLMVKRGICPMLLMQHREQTEPWDDPEDFDSDGFINDLSGHGSSDEEQGNTNSEKDHYRFDDSTSLDIFLMDKEEAERTKMLIQQDKSKPYFEKLIHNGVREVEVEFRNERLRQTGIYLLCYAAIVIVIMAVVLPLPKYGIL